MPLLIIDPKRRGASLPVERFWHHGGTQGQMLRYAITNLIALPPTDGVSLEQTRRAHWLRTLELWTAEAVDFVQLREKTVDAGELFQLTREGMHLLTSLRPSQSAKRPQLLVSGRPDLAAAARADGVHLTSSLGELTPAQIRFIFQAAGLPRCIVSVSCHTPAEASAARQKGADLVLFGPVFEKHIDGQQIADGTGLDHLGEACASAAPVPVLALGGVSSLNTAACMEKGAVGIAGIRLFARDTESAANMRKWSCDVDQTGSASR